jgi:hypothetical protein
MTVLGWIAVLVGAWCVVSVVVALGLGALLRRGSAVDDELSDQGRCRSAFVDGGIALWLSGLTIPDTPAELVASGPVSTNPPYTAD